MTTRYDIEETSWGYESYRDMVERPDGDFVHYSDYEKLANAAKLLLETHCCDDGGVEYDGTTRVCADCQPTREILEIWED